MDHDSERQDLIGHLFARVTAYLEDAATLAVEGQAAVLADTQRIADAIEQHLESASAFIKAIRFM